MEERSFLRVAVRGASDSRSKTMLSKTERLSRTSLSDLRGPSKRFAYGSFRLTRAPATKGAVVAQKKIFKTAVLRNAVRRKTLAALRKIFRTGALGGGVVVYLSREAGAASSQEIEMSLRKALRASRD